MREIVVVRDLSQFSVVLNAILTKKQELPVRIIFNNLHLNFTSRRQANLSLAVFEAVSEVYDEHLFESSNMIAVQTEAVEATMEALLKIQRGLQRV